MPFRNIFFSKILQKFEINSILTILFVTWSPRKNPPTPQIQYNQNQKSNNSIVLFCYCTIDNCKICFTTPIKHWILFYFSNNIHNVFSKKIYRNNYCNKASTTTNIHIHIHKQVNKIKSNLINPLDSRDRMIDVRQLICFGSDSTSTFRSAASCTSRLQQHPEYILLLLI